ncbi:MAG: TlpA family protein disulfide reductase [Clostridiales bacterium]|nr:TlpA family protein disulfide reductase [Clostridiales bacterium]
MKKIFSVLMILCLLLAAVPATCAGTASAEGRNTELLGKPFPDFTATDTDGNLFTLSEALKDHEAVLINFWATWCGPCRNEFPFLNEAYEQYHDRVAFIALSTEKKDTMEKIAEYRKENGISFSMGRCDDGILDEYVDTSGIPDTIIVDRFGNAVFSHDGALSGTRSVALVLDTFLGDGYTESAVLNEIPRDTFTHAYPISASRAIYPEDSGDDFRKVIIRSDQVPEPITGYIIPKDSVRLRIEIAPDDDAASMVITNMFYGETKPVASLLDPDRGVYVYDVEMPDPDDPIHYLSIALYDGVASEDNRQTAIYLYINEETVKETVEEANAEGPGKYTWEYAADTGENAENTPEAYIMHVVDQDGSPVEGVAVNFCSDTACTLRESDEDGLITFNGAPDAYHVTIVDAPDGYGYDEDYEMYTARVYGEWVLRVRKEK